MGDMSKEVLDAGIEQISNQVESDISDLVDADLLTESQARAYVLVDRYDVSREDASSLMHISTSGLDKHLRAARDKIQAAEQTRDVLSDDLPEPESMSWGAEHKVVERTPTTLPHPTVFIVSYDWALGWLEIRYRDRRVTHRIVGWQVVDVDIHDGGSLETVLDAAGDDIEISLGEAMETDNYSNNKWWVKFIDDRVLRVTDLESGDTFDLKLIIG